MRYAIFSDIHGNRQAWEAVLADMERLQVQIMVCLGDVVGYGPCPQEVLNAVRAKTDNIVVGNHDAAAAGMMDPSVVNPAAREAIEWTREQLDEESLSFLSEMPMLIRNDDLLFVHAEIEDPGRFGYLETIEDAKRSFNARDHRVAFVGHTHQPTLFAEDEDGVVTKWPDDDCVLDEDTRYIVNVGSVGEPRSYEDIRARYVIYDADRRKLFFRKIEFSAEAYRIELEGSGLEVTPFFLKVFDQQQAEAPQVAMQGHGEYDGSVQQLVVPEGTQGGSADMPVPDVARVRSRAFNPVHLVLPVLAMLAVIIVYDEFKDRDESGDAGAEGAVVIVPAESPLAKSEEGLLAEIVVVGPPREAVEGQYSKAEDALASVGPSVPLLDLEVEGPTSTVPAPSPPLPTPPAAPPPPPVEPPKLTGFSESLIFYASFDEDVAVLRDLSPGGRDLPKGGAMLGQAGQVGQACRLERTGALVSTAKPLPTELNSLAISFWLRLPPPEKQKDGEAAKPVAASNLVSFPDYYELKVENQQIVADLDRAGEKVAVDFPQDAEWHHVLVVNDGGITTIRIDERVSSDPVAEELSAVPPGDVALSIGSPEADFWIDELALWGRAFSPEERVNLYRRGRHGSPILTVARTVAHWRFDDEKKERVLEDSEGDSFLGSYKAWEQGAAIAPNPVPLTLASNKHAGQVLHLAEEPEKAGKFGLNSETPFTYEGWIRFPNGSGGSLGGAMFEKEGLEYGWRVAARRDRAAKGYLAFIYQAGGQKVQALGKDLALFDGEPHHFAAVWNPKDSASHGKLSLFLDNVEVATASLSLTQIQAEGPPAQFRIKSDRVPLLLDELRFSSDVLPPKRFLTAGLGLREAEDPFHKGETLLERRDREMRERKGRLSEAKKREEEERRVQEEERKRKAEEQRNREKLGS